MVPPSNDRADAVLSADAQTWEAVAENLSDGMSAFRAGRLRLRRDLHLGIGFLAATAPRDTGAGRLRIRSVEHRRLERFRRPRRALASRRSSCTDSVRRRPRCCRLLVRSPGQTDARSRSTFRASATRPSLCSRAYDPALLRLCGHRPTGRIWNSIGPTSSATAWADGWRSRFDLRAPDRTWRVGVARTLVGVATSAAPGLRT